MRSNLLELPRNVYAAGFGLDVRGETTNTKKVPGYGIVGNGGAVERTELVGNGRDRRADGRIAICSLVTLQRKWFWKAETCGAPMKQN